MTKRTTQRTVNFSEWEVQYIKDNFRDMSDEEMSRNLKRPILSVTRKRQRLGCFFVQQVIEGSIHGEVWKDFFLDDGYYQVSSKGRIKAGNKLRPVFVMKSGYTQIRVSNYKGQSGSFRVNRLVAEAFCPKPAGWTPEWHVHHKDKDRSNNTADNLEWLSPEQHRELHKTS